MRAGGVTAADVFLLPSELPALQRVRERREEWGRGGEKRKKGDANAHHLRNEFIEVAVFFAISKCLVQRFK